MAPSLVKNVTNHKTVGEFEKYVGNVETFTKAEAQKARNKLPRPGDAIEDPEKAKLTEQILESIKSGKANKEKLQEFLNSLNEQQF